MGTSQQRQATIRQAHVRIAHFRGIDGPAMSPVASTVKTTRISCGRVPAAAAPHNARARSVRLLPVRLKQTAASICVLNNPAARLSVRIFVAVIQIAGVISRQIATHQASRLSNCSHMIRNHAAIRRPPPIAPTNCRETSGVAPVRLQPRRPRNI